MQLDQFARSAVGTGYFIQRTCLGAKRHREFHACLTYGSPDGTVYAFSLYSKERFLQQYADLPVKLENKASVIMLEGLGHSLFQQIKHRFCQFVMQSDQQHLVAIPY